MTELEELKKMFRAVTGRELEPLTPPEVLRRLQQGESGLVLVLDFDAEHPRHQLVLERIDGQQRIHFFNPWKPAGHAPGVELTSPPRRVEPDHLESVSYETFRDFFTKLGAECYSAKL